MSIQVLVATMHQNEFSLVERMNLQSDAIVINQTDKYDFSEFDYHGNKIKFFSFNERGVGLSRNTALMRATSEIIVFADEDMIYADLYPELIQKEFDKNPKADIIIFSIDSLSDDRPLLRISKDERISRFRALKYGCARIAVRREKLIVNNIWFSILFGGGARYSSGEDTIFLQDCFKNKLKVYVSTVKIACVKQEDSTWFKGYNEQYYFDKGVLMAAILPRICWIYAIMTALKMRQSKKGLLSRKRILQFLFKGIMHFKSVRKTGIYEQTHYNSR